MCSFLVIPVHESGRKFKRSNQNCFLIQVSSDLNKTHVNKKRPEKMF